MSISCVLDLQQPQDINQRLRHQTLDDATETTIARCPCDVLIYNDFFWNNMYTNWPVVLTGVSNSWACRRHWTKVNNNNTGNQIDNITDTTTNTPNTAIDYDYLRVMVGNCQVPVANCSKEYFNSHAKCEMNFHDFLDYWQQKCEQEINHNAKTSITPTNSNILFEEPTVRTENLYLKDWHLKAQMPGYDFYTVPKYFASDWLNEYLIDKSKDDYRFVYMGPKDSWTPFHADVFGSYSWSTNIIGCKRWLLLPPGEENRLKDKLGNVPFRISEQMLTEQHVRHFIIEQKENESIFVPSGWYHQVHNMTDTISVNHNWFNACNLHKIWQNLASNMQQVIAEIEDCRQMEDFDEHCHTMLRASFGLNFYDFLNMLEYIAAKRTAQCNNNNEQSSTDAASNAGTVNATKYLLFNTYTLSDHHVRYDLHCINAIVQEMLQNAVITDSRAVLYRRCLSLKELTKHF